MTKTMELVEGDELIATGTRAKLEKLMDHLIGSYEPEGEREGEPAPDYRIQPAE